MKVKATRFMRMDDLRNLCIRNDWMTKMNNDQYSEFLTMYGNGDNLADNTILTMAMVVAKFSDFKKYGYDPIDNRIEILESVMFEIANTAHTTYELMED